MGGDLLHTMDVVGLSRVSIWAGWPAKSHENHFESKGRIEEARSGEIEFAVEELRLSTCLIRSVRG